MTLVLTQNVFNYNWGKYYKQNHSTRSNGGGGGGVSMTWSEGPWKPSQKKAIPAGFWGQAWISPVEGTALVKALNWKELTSRIRYILLSPFYTWSSWDLQRLSNFLRLRTTHELKDSDLPYNPASPRGRNKDTWQPLKTIIRRPSHAPQGHRSSWRSWEQVFICSLYWTPDQIKLKASYFRRKSPASFLGMKSSSLLPKAFHTIMVQSQAINDSEKMGLCDRGKRLFKLLLISIKERSFDLWNSYRAVWSFSNSFILDSCKFLFCRFTSLENSIFNWTVTFIHWNAILNSWSLINAIPAI